MIALRPRRWLAATLILATVPASVRGCSRALFNKFSDDIVLSGRSMDWQFCFDDYLFVVPRGVRMEGSADEANPATWTSKYGSVVSSIIGWAGKYGCDFTKDGATDGMNEAGLAAHILNLVGTEYPKPNTGGKKSVTYMRWLRYVLDNFATVSEAVKGVEDVNVISTLIHGSELGAHMAIEDASGDSAVFEVVDGRIEIYHGREVLVMTNDPPYDQQLDLLKRYEGFGGDLPLPGSTSSEDRFVRLSYYLGYLKKPKDDIEAVAKVHSLMMNTNVPFDAPYGMYGEGIYPTWWTSYCDLTDKVYYFNWMKNPFLIWVEFENLSFAPGSDILVLNPRDPTINGEVSSLFIKAGENAPHAALGGNLNSQNVALLGGVSSFSEYHTAQEGNALRTETHTSFAVVSSLFIGAMLGFFLHKSIAPSRGIGVTRIAGHDELNTEGTSLLS